MLLFCLCYCFSFLFSCQLLGLSGDDDDDDEDDGNDDHDCDGDHQELDTLAQLALDQLEESRGGDGHAAALLPLVYTTFSRGCDGSLRKLDTADESCVVRFYASNVFGIADNDGNGSSTAHMWRPLGVALDAGHVPLGAARRAIKR